MSMPSARGHKPGQRPTSSCASASRPALFGVGIDANIVSASMKAVLSGMQRVGALTQDDRSRQWATS